MQIFLRRKVINRKLSKYADIWPIDSKAGYNPEGFTGWPDHKQFSLILRHDVETAKGQEKCYELVELEKKLGFVSTYNLVPEKYRINDDLRFYLVENGFEVGVHGLKHDGKLYYAQNKFIKRAKKINHYLKEWKASGFFSPSSHHNLEWLHELNILYDSSTFDNDPFEPQPDGVNTIFPFIVKKNHTEKSYVEIPYTLPQDFTLFVLLKEKRIDIWKKKLDWIVNNNGMVFLNSHPDYMKFNKEKLKINEYNAELYVEFLEYVKTRYEGQYWHVLPKEMAIYWSRKFS